MDGELVGAKLLVEARGLGYLRVSAETIFLLGKFLRSLLDFPVYTLATTRLI